MKESLILKIKERINEIENEETINQEKIEYLNKHRINYQYLSELNFKELLKIFFLTISNIDYDYLCEATEYLDDVLDKINELVVEPFGDLLNDLLYFVEEGRFDEIMVDSEDELINLQITDSAYNLLIFLFTKNKEENDVDFLKYNIFMSFLNEQSKISAVIYINKLLEIKGYKTKFGKKLIEYKEVINIIKNDCPELFETLSIMQKALNDLNDKNKKDKLNKNKKLNELKKIITQIEKEKLINIEDFIKVINEEELLRLILIYNNKLLSKEYIRKKQINNDLKSNDFSIKDEILNRYNFKLNIDNIKINNDELESKLILINDELSEIKKYTNIVSKLINDISYKNLETLCRLVKNNKLNTIFIAENIDMLIEPIKGNNCISNINLLLENNINILQIIKNDQSVLFMDNNKLNEIINIYNKYGINLSNEYYNYKFLKENYSYIIDYFIEIGEYDLIKENASLITDKSNIIIKRCLIYKALGNKCANEQGKLRGSLRKRENFILDDNIVNETIIPNYEIIIPEDILKVLSNEVENTDCNIDLSFLEQFKIDDVSYKIGTLIVSKYKILKNLTILYKNKMYEKYKFNDLLIYSCIYNYPNIIDIKTLNNIKQKAKKLI